MMAHGLLAHFGHDIFILEAFWFRDCDELKSATRCVLLFARRSGAVGSLPASSAIIDSRLLWRRRRWHGGPKERGF